MRQVGLVVVLHLTRTHQLEDRAALAAGDRAGLAACTAVNLLVGIFSVRDGAHPAATETLVVNFMSSMLELKITVLILSQCVQEEDELILTRHL